MVWFTWDTPSHIIATLKVSITWLSVSWFLTYLQIFTQLMGLSAPFWSASIRYHVTICNRVTETTLSAADWASRKIYKWQVWACFCVRRSLSLIISIFYSNFFHPLSQIQIWGSSRINMDVLVIDHFWWMWVLERYRNQLCDLCSMPHRALLSLSSLYQAQEPQKSM